MSSEGQRSLGLFFRTADNHHGEKVGCSFAFVWGDVIAEGGHGGRVPGSSFGADGHQKPFFVGQFRVFGSVRIC